MNANFSIIGAGNLGTHLIHALTAAGYNLASIYKKSKFGYFSGHVTHDIDQLLSGVHFVVIATGESQIEPVARLLAASRHCKDKIIFHTCNGLTSDQLQCLKKKGAYIASFSPLQTFPPFHNDTGGNVFKGIPFLVEGDKNALTLLKQLAKDLGAETLEVEKEKKIYFHIAGVAASNFLVSILKLAQLQLNKTGNIHETPGIEILLPLIRQTLDNIASKGLTASLTGPFKRKEMGIIEKHLAHLEKEEAELYQGLTQFLAHR
jgi:predicted short-subunit dehydrogenase-like oxidoreductase (DUF2520 family)